MNRLDYSEIVTGLVLSGKIPVTHINPSHLSSPYDQAVMLLRDGKGDMEVVDKLGLALFSTAKEAASQVDPLMDWLSQLEKAAGREQLADVLEKETKRLRRGEDIDSSRINAAMDRQHNFGNRYITLDKVDPQKVVWRKTYYEPLDYHLGGIPEAGLAIIGAPPGTGKTSLMMSFAIGAAKAGKTSLIYTFEMTSAQLLHRILQFAELSMEERSRITVCEEMLSVDEVFADASRLAVQNEFNFIGLDFADLMLRGDVDEPKVGHIYVTCAILAKTAKTPVVLLSQLNREYVGGMPRVHHIRWSGLAEAVGALIMLLYNPKATWTDYGKGNEKLPIIEGKGYIICGKSRFGFGDEEGLGAIQVEWLGKEAWGKESFGWYPL